jgi:hypothetical protein
MTAPQLITLVGRPKRYAAQVGNRYVAYLSSVIRFGRSEGALVV